MVNTEKSTIVVQTDKKNVDEIIADAATTALGKGAVISSAVDARNKGYLDSYVVRQPGSSGYQTQITTPVTTLAVEQTTRPAVEVTTISSQEKHIHHLLPNYRPATVSNTFQYNYSNNLENELRNARVPLSVPEREFINVGKYSGIYLNRAEVENWRGPIPIDNYRLNDDPNPEVIKKRSDKIVYTQECVVRYLEPPPVVHGDLIVEEQSTNVTPAPPLIIRQEGERPYQPRTESIHEAPPTPPARLPEQVIKVEGKSSVALPRRVIVEKLNNLPPRPADRVIERWLPYKEYRNVVHRRAHDVTLPVQRNLVIEWEAPDVEVKTVCKDVGPVRADPDEYVRKYGDKLRPASEVASLCSSLTSSQVIKSNVDQQVVFTKPALVEHHHHSSGYHGHSHAHLHNYVPYYSTGYYNHHHNYHLPHTVTTSTVNVVNANQSAHHSTHEVLNLNQGHEIHLVGQTEALRLIDLDRAGLSEYKNYVTVPSKHISL